MDEFILAPLYLSIRRFPQGAGSSSHRRWLPPPPYLFRDAPDHLGKASPLLLGLQAPSLSTHLPKPEHIDPSPVHTPLNLHICSTIYLKLVQTRTPSSTYTSPAPAIAQTASFPNTHSLLYIRSTLLHSRRFPRLPRLCAPSYSCTLAWSAHTNSLSPECGIRGV